MLERARVFAVYAMTFLVACACPQAIAGFDEQVEPNNRGNPDKSNLPPCALPPLTNDQVLEIAHRAFGDEPKGMPPPNRRIEIDGCRYRYEQSIFYFNKQPAALDSVDATASIYISRDGTWKHW